MMNLKDGFIEEESGRVVTRSWERLGRRKRRDDD
jgi:hypothetical protein